MGPMHEPAAGLRSFHVVAPDAGLFCYDAAAGGFRDEAPAVIMRRCSLVQPSRNPAEAGVWNVFVDSARDWRAEDLEANDRVMFDRLVRSVDLNVLGEDEPVWPIPDVQKAGPDTMAIGFDE